MVNIELNFWLFILFSIFSEENSDRPNKAHINNLSDGQVAIFPQGTIHYEQNLGCKPAHFISALNHEDPGSVYKPFLSLIEYFIIF